MAATATTEIYTNSDLHRQVADLSESKLYTYELRSPSGELVLSGYRTALYIYQLTRSMVNGCTIHVTR